MKPSTLLQSLLLLATTACFSFAFVPQSTQMKRRMALFAHDESSDKDPSFDMNALQRRIASAYTSSSTTPSASSSAHADSFYIIQVQLNSRQREKRFGVHTIESPTTGQNRLLAFETLDQAQKFCDLLQLQNSFPNTAVIQLPLVSLVDMCHELGVYPQFVPTGLDVLPPAQNSQHFGNKHPSLREQQEQLEYLFSMTETDFAEQEGIVLEGSWE